MSIGPRLELRQSQQLVMTPQLQQAIKLLQMTSVELGAFVETELERNPILERASGEEVGEERPETTRERESERLDGVDVVVRSGDVSDVERPFDTGRENLYDSDAPRPAAAAPLVSGMGPGGGSGPAWDGDGDPVEELLAQPVSMLSHLEAQIALSPEPPAVRAVACALAADLDEAGYLRVEVEEAAARLGATPDEAARGLAVLQGCEPAGIGARDLAECLALQLRERDRLDPAMQAMLDNLALVARADYRRSPRSAAWTTRICAR